MNNFEEGHESGPNAAVPDTEKFVHRTESAESHLIPVELQGMPVSCIVKGIRALRFAESAEQS